MGEAGTFVSVLLKRHSQLLETTLLRIDQPRAAIVKQIPGPASQGSDDTDKDNSQLRSALKAVQLQLTGANRQNCYDSCCVFDGVTAALSDIQTLRHTLTDR